MWLHNLELPGLAMTRSFGDKIGVQAGVIGDPGKITRRPGRREGREMAHRFPLWLSEIILLGIQEPATE